MTVDFRHYSLPRDVQEFVRVKSQMFRSSSYISALLFIGSTPLLILSFLSGSTPLIYASFASIVLNLLSTLVSHALGVHLSGLEFEARKIAESGIEVVDSYPSAPLAGEVANGGHNGNEHSILRQTGEDGRVRHHQGLFSVPYILYAQYNHPLGSDNFESMDHVNGQHARWLRSSRNKESFLLELGLGVKWRLARAAWMLVWSSGVLGVLGNVVGCAWVLGGPEVGTPVLYSVSGLGFLSFLFWVILTRNQRLRSREDGGVGISLG